jgi:hypothetical protein
MGVVEEPPPYSRRQPSTSSNRLRAQSDNRGRFMAPEPIQRHSPAPLSSPRVIVSHSEQDVRAASFTDLAMEKPTSPKCVSITRSYYSCLQHPFYNHTVFFVDIFNLSFHFPACLVISDTSSISLSQREQDWNVPGLHRSQRLISARCNRCRFQLLCTKH